MDIKTTYMIAIGLLIPVFSAIACGILVTFSLQDSLTREERNLKRIVLFYLSLSGIGWFVTFCYQFIPVWFVWLNVACLLTFILPSIFFYRIIRYLTRLGKPEIFSPLHYLLPGALAAVMLIGSLFVPFDIQLEIVKGKAEVFPQGYEVYTKFFTAKPLLRVIFGIVYYLFTIQLLAVYYKRANEKNTLVRKPAKWVLFLVGISLASLLSSVLPTFMPRSQIFHSIWMFTVASSIAAQHVLLSYHIIRRNYLLYVIPEKTKERFHETKSNPSRRQYSGDLNRTRFENFFREKKPYLDPDYKITNLVEDLDVNRTVLSAFINQTYGINFNRYLNRYRLKELEQLRLQPPYQGKSISSLIDKVGFKDFRNYSRAIAAERGVATKKETYAKRKADSEKTTAPLKEIEVKRKTNTKKLITAQNQTDTEEKINIKKTITDQKQTGAKEKIDTEKTNTNPKENDNKGKTATKKIIAVQKENDTQEKIRVKEKVAVSKEVIAKKEIVTEKRTISKKKGGTE